MKDITIENCSQCGLELFEWKEGERVNNYETMQGTIPHTQLRCEIHQIISTRINGLEAKISKIIERMDL